MYNIDPASSFAKLTGATIPDDACLDSLDVLSAFLGENNEKSRDELVPPDNGNKSAKSNYGLRSGN